MIDEKKLREKLDIKHLKYDYRVFSLAELEVIIQAVKECEKE